MSEIDKAEPMPTENEKSIPVSEILKKMIDERTKLGMSKYGTILKTFNGRDCMNDAMQEAIDLSQYLAQKVIELEQELKHGIKLKDANDWETSLIQVIGYAALQQILNDKIPKQYKGNAIVTAISLAIKKWRKENHVVPFETRFKPF